MTNFDMAVKAVAGKTALDHDDTAVLRKELGALQGEYEGLKAQNIKIDMQRGRPCAEQLDLANEALDWHGAPFVCEDGVDARNYGGDLGGTPECKRLFADIFDVLPENIIIGGNSSLNLMYDAIVKAMLLGVYGAKGPWMAYPGKPKFLCPSPGYDRHFTVAESFGLELVTIKMNSDGPDMDEVERHVNEDPSVVGIWCVPKYSNPDGITYSDEVVRRFAALRPKADGFRVFWDNAYFCHDLYDESDKLLNIFDECKKTGNEDMFYMFASTSKITFAGSGVSVFVSSKNNVEFLKKQMFVQTIGPDKVNQLRQVRYIKSAGNLKKLMQERAQILRPKFDSVLSVLSEEMGGSGICQWNNPRGGYFVSLNAPSGCASKAVGLAASAGVLFTGAGATFPYKKDPEDRNIRIAPTIPPASEVRTAVKALCLCIKIAYIEKLLQQ